MATIVYGGPGKKAYAAIGSIDASDPYTVLWEEYGWRFIQYSVSTQQDKRGYIEGGSASACPSAYQGGVLGTMDSPEFVYGGPGESDYAQLGSVSSSEKVTVLIANDSGFAFIEYQTSTGAKRGYVRYNTVTRDTTTALAKMTEDANMYAAPFLFGASYGLLYQEEFVVVLRSNSYVCYVEYNTTTERKRAYVFAWKLNRINTSASVPALPLYDDNFKYGTVMSNSVVYGGPSPANYAVIGSVDYLEIVGVVHQEGNYYFTVYSTAAGAKQGFVLADNINLAAGITIPDKTNSYTGWADLTNAPTTVYAGPNPDIYTTIGAVAANEAVTVFSGAENNYYQIEYSTAAGPKRGYIHTNNLRHYDLGGLAIANSRIVVHYTPELNTTPEYGAIGAGEFVVILEKNDSVCYIEYNTSSARKRGYTAASGYIFKNMSNVPALPELSSSFYMANSNLAVYAGPSNQYASVGSISQNEPVVRLKENVYGYAYIDYIGSGIKKRGYVPTSALSVYYAVVIPSYSFPNVYSAVYGQSGAGRDLVYYRIGTGNKHLILNFAIRGFEDNWYYDGMELVNLAGSVLQMLSDNFSTLTTNGWSVFVIPSSNPDGLIDGTTNDGPGRCTTYRYGSTRGVLVQGGVDVNRSFEPFEVMTSSRNYTRPEAYWCKESEALRDFIANNKSTAGTNVFIDAHGWTQQIIVVGGSASSLGNIFKNYFPNNSYADLSSAKGYVARYAHSLGMNACLFEFPGDVGRPGDLILKGYDSAYKQAIMQIISQF